MSNVHSADHAWVPAGSHYMDKMSHEAATPNRPPNSPQGVQAPSSSSSPKRPLSSSSRRHGSQQKPAWDSWGFSKLPLEGSGTASGSGKRPTRSALKNLTASWSPTRKGFVKPEIARSSAGFSHSHRRKATVKHAASGRQSPQQCSKLKPGNRHHADKDKARTACASKGKPDMPQSCMQPILHSQHSNVLPGEGLESPTQSQQFSAAQSKNGRTKKKKKGSRRKAAQHAQQAVGNAEQQSKGLEGTLPRVIATNMTQAQGSYISPLQSHHRRGAQNSWSPAECNSSFVIMPGSSHDRNPAGASDSAGSAQYSPSHSSGETECSMLCTVLQSCISTAWHAYRGMANGKFLQAADSIHDSSHCRVGHVRRCSTCAISRVLHCLVYKPPVLQCVFKCTASEASLLQGAFTASHSMLACWQYVEIKQCTLTLIFHTRAQTVLSKRQNIGGMAILCVSLV